MTLLSTILTPDLRGWQLIFSGNDSLVRLPNAGCAGTCAPATIAQTETNPATSFLHSTELPNCLVQLNGERCGRSTHTNVCAMQKMLTLLWPWAWQTWSPVAAQTGTIGCRLTLEEPVLPGLPASLPSCPHHILLILLQTVWSQPARSFISPCLFTHFKLLFVRMFFLLPTALLTALLMWFFSHLPVKMCLTTLLSPF